MLEEQLRVATTRNEIGRQVTVQEHHEGEQCLVVGESILRNVGTGQNNNGRVLSGYQNGATS